MMYNIDLRLYVYTESRPYYIGMRMRYSEVAFMLSLLFIILFLLFSVPFGFLIMNIEYLKAGIIRATLIQRI